MGLDETIKFLTEEKGVRVKSIHERIGVTENQWYQKLRSSEIRRNEFAKSIRDHYPEYQDEFEAKMPDAKKSIEEKYINLLEKTVEELKEEKEELKDEIRRLAAQISSLMGK